MGEFIQEVAAICEKIRLEVGSDKHIGLSFDEWNVWYHYAKNGRGAGEVDGRPPH